MHVFNYSVREDERILLTMNQRGRSGRYWDLTYSFDHYIEPWELQV